MSVVWGSADEPSSGHVPYDTLGDTRTDADNLGVVWVNLRK